jgi:hypothetical protein
MERLNLQKFFGWLPRFIHPHLMYLSYLYYNINYQIKYLFGTWPRISQHFLMGDNICWSSMGSGQAIKQALYGLRTGNKASPLSFSRSRHSIEWGWGWGTLMGMPQLNVIEAPYVIMSASSCKFSSFSIYVILQISRTLF